MILNLVKLSVLFSKLDDFLITSNAHKTHKTMNTQTAIAQLKTAQTGDELLNVLDNLQGGFKYIESPMIEQVLGIATLEPIEF